MKVNGKNESIECTIKNCTFHDQKENYWTGSRLAHMRQTPHRRNARTVSLL